MRASTASWRATFLAGSGAGLEYCDFVIYLLLAPYLGAAFFPAEPAWMAQLQALGLFAAGYIARPAGGLVFGTLGDRVGRRATFLRTTGLMAVATCVIGCLPTYASVGMAAPIALVALRCLQGFSMGGELPGAITYVAEHAPAGQRGRRCGLVAAGMALGGILASTFLAWLTHFLGDAAMQAWGWRVPFFCGGGVALGTQLLRHQLPESPVFLKQQPLRHELPLTALLREQRLQVVSGVCMAVCASGLVIFPLYAPTFIHRTFGYSLAAIYGATSAGMIWAVCASPIVGRLVDQWNGRRLVTAAGLGCMTAIVPLLTLLQHGAAWALYAFMFAWQTLLTIFVVSYWTVLIQRFAARVRTSALGLCINAGLMLGSLLPLLFEQLGIATRPVAVVALSYAGLGLLGIVGAWAVPQRLDLEDSRRGLGPSSVGTPINMRC